MERTQTQVPMLLVLPARELRVDLFGAQVHGDLVLRSTGDGLLQALYKIRG